jgi:hypothetical protein
MSSKQYMFVPLAPHYVMMLQHLARGATDGAAGSAGAGQQTPAGDIRQASHRSTCQQYKLSCAGCSVDGLPMCNAPE